MLTAIGAIFMSTSGHTSSDIDWAAERETISSIIREIRFIPHKKRATARELQIHEKINDYLKGFQYSGQDNQREAIKIFEELSKTDLLSSPKKQAINFMMNQFRTSWSLDMPTEGLLTSVAQRTIDTHIIYPSPSERSARGIPQTLQGFLSWSNLLDMHDPNFSKTLHGEFEVLKSTPAYNREVLLQMLREDTLNHFSHKNAIISFIEGDIIKRQRSDDVDRTHVSFDEEEHFLELDFTDSDQFGSSTELYSKSFDAYKRFDEDDSLPRRMEVMFNQMKENTLFDPMTYDRFVQSNKHLLTSRHINILSRLLTKFSVDPESKLHFPPLERPQEKWKRFSLELTKYVDPERAAKLASLEKVKTRVDDILKKIVSPDTLVAHLSTVIMGQDLPKRLLSLAVYDHYKKIAFNTEQEMASLKGEQAAAPKVSEAAKAHDADVAPEGGAGSGFVPHTSDVDEDSEDALVDLVIQPTQLKKQNVLLVGPSGSGKTLMMQMISERIGVPVYVADATQFTSEGYIGGKVSSVIPGLFGLSDKDPMKAQLGIVFIDEIDKTKKESSASGRDIIGRVQTELLKMIEGRIEEVKVEKGGPIVSIDTKNIMFVFAGAFADLTMPPVEIDPKYEETLLSKLSERRRLIDILPYVEELKTSLKPLSIEQDFVAPKSIITTRELHEYGMMPEFIGRIGAIINLDHLDKSIFCEILTKSRGSMLLQQKILFEEDGIKFEVTKGGLDTISELALLTGSGGRGIEQVLSGLSRSRFDEAVKLAGVIRITKKLIEDINPVLIERRAKLAADKVRYKLLVDEVAEQEKKEMERRRNLKSIRDAQEADKLKMKELNDAHEAAHARGEFKHMYG